MGAIITVLVQGHPTKAELENGWGTKRDLPVSEHNVWCDKACKNESAALYDRWEREEILEFNERLGRAFPDYESRLMEWWDITAHLIREEKLSFEQIEQLELFCSAKGIKKVTPIDLKNNLSDWRGIEN